MKSNKDVTFSINTNEDQGRLRVPEWFLMSPPRFLGALSCLREGPCGDRSQVLVAHLIDGTGCVVAAVNGVPTLPRDATELFEWPHVATSLAPVGDWAASSLCTGLNPLSV